MSFFVKNSIVDRQEKLQQDWKKGDFAELFAVSEALSEANRHNCENMIGAVTLPIGLAGPVKIILEDQLEDRLINPNEYFVPLATSEGALVASVGRGLKAINQAGGSQVFVQNVGMTRAPVFAFRNGKEAFDFASYLKQTEVLIKIKQITQATSQHLQFQNLQVFVRGRNVYVRFSFLTGEAMGMNMATIALQKLWDDFLNTYPGIQMLALSSNVCTDKKASFINQLLGRGYMAQAEVFLTEDLVQTVLKTSLQAMLDTYHGKNQIGSNLAGTFSNNMQFANVVAAFYMATGQDLAHITEASQGTTIIEATSEGLYIAVNLPDLPLGSVGGGTNLPTQSQLRNLIHQGQEKLNPTVLAGILATGVLAAEISGLAALSNNSLAQAHQRLARSKE